MKFDKIYNIKKTIKELCLEKKITKKELSRKTKISIYKFDKCNSLTLEELQKIAEFFDTNIFMLLINSFTTPKNKKFVVKLGKIAMSKCGYEKENGWYYRKEDGRVIPESFIEMAAIGLDVNQFQKFII